MAMSVKDLLKADLPPTHADAEMRKKHTLGSITHNSNHIKDHAKGLEESLEKLYTVDSKEYERQLKKELASLKQIYDHMCKMLKKGGTASKTYKSKGFQA